MNNLNNTRDRQNYCLKDQSGRIVETFHGKATAQQQKSRLEKVYGDLSLESCESWEKEKYAKFEGLKAGIKQFKRKKK